MNPSTACLFGILSIGLAFGAEKTGANILAATITAMGALSGPLGAVFMMGILMPFINRAVSSTNDVILMLKLTCYLLFIFILY